MHGWEFVLPHDVVVEWDGISNTEHHHVKILEGEFLPNGKKLVDTHTANSTIAFNLNAFLETDDSHYSILMGPPNHFVDGAKPMTALIRTDWYKHNPLQYCWILTKPNVPITFKADTPFLFLMNYPKYLLESTDFTIKTATEEQMNKSNLYMTDRNEFYKQNPGLKFANMYKKGVDATSDDANHFIDKIYKPRPSDPIYE
jgi:hypothetical protein